jgi:uncharacterized membrane protein YgdD (TMEM256/DUF423 family)
VPSEAADDTPGEEQVMNGWGWIRIGAVLGFLGVAIGAFGAHGLKARLEALGTTTTFHTGVEYHFYHALALLAVGLIWGPLTPSRASNVAGWAFLVGVILFSGSIYVLSVTGYRRLGMITPFGGVAFLVGWLALVVAASTMGGWPAAGTRPGPTLLKAPADPVTGAGQQTTWDMET